MPSEERALLTHDGRGRRQHTRDTPEHMLAVLLGVHGHGQVKAAQGAAEAFDAIYRAPHEWLQTRVHLEKARRLRYANGSPDITAEWEAILAR